MPFLRSHTMASSRSPPTVDACSPSSGAGLVADACLLGGEATRAWGSSSFLGSSWAPPSWPCQEAWSAPRPLPVLLALLHAFTEVVLDVAADGDLRRCRGGLLDVLDRLGGVLDEVLPHEAFSLTILSRRPWTIFSRMFSGLILSSIFICRALSLDRGGVDVVGGDVLDVRARRIRMAMFDELLEAVAARDKVSLAATPTMTPRREPA